MKIVLFTGDNCTRCREVAKLLTRQMTLSGRQDLKLLLRKLNDPLAASWGVSRAPMLAVSSDDLGDYRLITGEITEEGIRRLLTSSCFTSEV